MNAVVQPPPAPPPQAQFSPEQIIDIARLFAASLTRGNIVSVATLALGRDAQADAANDLNDASALAQRLVQVLAAEQRLADAVALLRREAHINGRLMLGLNCILRGQRLDADAALQAFVNDYEPFISSASVQTVLPRVIRSVCAVWLGEPHNKIVGTGFLIGPEHVLTNFHVIEAALSVQADGSITANAPSSSLYFIFDYLAEPPPKLPPPKAPCSSCNGVAIRAADDWLVHARQSLAHDGTPHAAAEVKTEYDYAVVKLATPIGGRPARSSGGAIRGWLALPEQVDVLVAKKRVMLFQHPGATCQQYDMGDFIKADINRKRVWYSVSSAKGSSGGAAVDSDGAVFALHNAEVLCPPAPVGSTYNQGVRIDAIAKDLQERGWSSPPPPDASNGALEYWSLSDDIEAPLPIIGRAKFREYVELMASPTGKRVLVVTGQLGSGVRFSTRLLRRLLSPLAGMVVFTRSDLETLTPERFLRTLVNGLDITDLSSAPLPPAPATESMARWLRLDLPKWLAGRIASDEQRTRGRYPAWIVLDAFIGETQRLLWAENLKELVAALAGAHDPGQGSIDLPQLRWVFLVGPSDTAPVANVERFEDDLREQRGYDIEFADCMELSWRCVERQEGLGRKMLETFGRNRLKLFRDEPPRKALANFVRDMFLEGRPE